MRRHFLPVVALAAIFLAAPVTYALAQQGGGGADDEGKAAEKKKKDSEWEDKQAPLPGLRNAGPCPFVKVLYDASRYIEFEANKESAATVGYTGEIQNLAAGCRYRGAEPIHLEIEILFALGKGPRADGASKTYQYWVAVTDRNRTVLAKEYFPITARFAPGQDRVLMTDKLANITIPRGGQNVSGSNFEVLVGFEVTPQMVQFNRDGKRFRVNAGSTTAASGSSTTQ